MSDNLGGISQSIDLNNPDIHKRPILARKNDITFCDQILSLARTVTAQPCSVNMPNGLYLLKL